MKEHSGPALVFQEADLSVRVVRDIFSEHFERAIVDDEQQHHRLVSFFSRTAPELVDRVELYDGEDPLFEAYGVDPVINGMLERRVDLPSGGYLIIDYAEALTVIDVNTGSFTGKGKSARLEDTITKTNLEAADEVVRQLRLRDIGGIIVIDFIDMARSRNRDAVLKVLRKALDEDRTKTFVVEISPLGLVEMTRQNVTDGVREIMTKPCPVCSGEGVVKSEETIAIEFARHLRHMVIEAGEAGPEAYLLRINPKVTAWFIADGARELHALERETGRYFHFEGSDGLPLDHFAVTMEGTRAEIEEHAVPFRAGEEVHVDLVEPHMYNDDDAVAKVDGYLIDVVNGIAFVGEKKLVRIEEAGRTIARAVLTGADAEAAEDRRHASAPRRARRRCRARAARPRPRRARPSAARPRDDARRRDARRGRAPRPARVEDADERPRRRAGARRRRPALRGRRRRGRRRGGRRGRRPRRRRRSRPRAAAARASARPSGGRGRGGRGRAEPVAARGGARAAPARGRARKRPPRRRGAGRARPSRRRAAGRRGARRPRPSAAQRRAKPAAEPEPEAVDEAEEDDDDEDRGRRRAILSPSAPWPQRWTAPFAREGPGRRRSLRLSPDLRLNVLRSHQDRR